MEKQQQQPQLLIRVFHSTIAETDEVQIHTPFQKWIARVFRLYLRKKFIYTIKVQAANYPIVSPGEIFVSAEGINWIITEIAKYHPHIITMKCLSPQEHMQPPAPHSAMAPVARSFSEKSK